MAAPPQPHALVFPMDGPGHFNALLSLSDRLADEEHGLQITVVLPQVTVDRNRASLEREHPRMGFVGVPDGRADVGFKSIGEVFKSLDRMQEPLEDLLQSLDPPATLIIADGFVGWMQDVADKFGIPRVCFWASSATCEILYFNLPFLISRGYVPLKDPENANELITIIPGLHPARRKDLPHCFLHEAQGLELMTSFSQRTVEALCVIGNTFEELEAEAIAANQEKLRYFPIGPLLPPWFFQDEHLPEPTEEGDVSCIDWLDKESPGSILYIAFGSGARLATEQADRLLKALEAAKFGFLWVFKDPDDDALLRKAQSLEGGRVVPWAPQLRVLRHDSVGGFLSHSGWNSTMEAICSGVPLLTWPRFAEQNLNAKMVVDKWKIGLEINNDDPNALVEPDKLVQVMNAVMDGGQVSKELKANAMKLSEAAKGAASQGGSSHKNLLEFIEYSKNQAKKQQG
ncbi:hypothetical protein SELMODRAFT_414397 [Selaginella moellendorffii]|uniref:Glycosyltransferase n=1 Tax=Selaginella moellendorffii TaxID=88036 RepID=D8RSM2_SELML|nr:UDP-glycosyltransferase 87A1 [Selaginella moellendorffii]EFJ25096.1 hypothetical protein SELMODRAFT_414397 [Selaginella moellendorffii]|eukprot:XP_002974141.1 UDP-glycosyltransferase 87A1 [Selaginella moellendorffii]